MNTIQLSAGKSAGLLLGWWFLFVLFSVNDWNPLGLLYIVGVPFLLFVPGFLTLTLLAVRGIETSVRAVLSVGLSVLELMALGVVSNTLWPLFGVDRPLDTQYVVWAVSTLFFLLLTLTVWRFSSVSFVRPTPTSVGIRNALFALTPLVFVAMSVWGARTLNEGGANTITMLMLLLMGVYVWQLYKNAGTLNKNVVPIALYLLSLALLLMTSMRGAFIAGHDIQREFFVFQLAKDAGVWSMQTYLDAYNACMSITVLPTILAHMLHIPDPYIYKVLFQVVFAAAPVVTFLIARKFLTTPLAYLSALFFIAFPTFFQDMPFLIRQEIAFLFYGLMVYVLFEDAFSQRLRSTLAVLLGLGVILSHYSTTYTILFVLLLTTLTTPIIFRLVRFVRAKSFLRESSLGSALPQAPLPKRRVSVPMVMVLTASALLWTSVITGTDAHARDVAGDIWAAVIEGTDAQHSVDVMTIFSFGRVQHDRTLDEYIENVVDVRRAEAPALYYATSTFVGYQFTVREPTELPYTAAGAVPSEDTPLVGQLVTFMGQLLAKVIQVAILVGFVYVLFRRRWIYRMDTEFYTLAGFALLFVALCVIVPLMSVEYGLFRALQQSLFLLAPLVVTGILVLSTGFVWLLRRWCELLQQVYSMRRPCIVRAELVAGCVGVLFLLYASGFMTQLVGGNVPPVHLNNVGDDYNHYVTTPAEVEAIEWLEEQLARDTKELGVQPVVHSDRYGQKKIRAFVLARVGGDMLPMSLLQDAYVFVPTAVLVGGTATINYEGSAIKYDYPLAFLDENKEVVFDNGAVRIYQ